MNTAKDNLIIKLLLMSTIVLIVVASINMMYLMNLTEKHICSDPTHIRCDGLCECDGFECNESSTSKTAINPRDYQIEDIYTDTNRTIYVYDNNRLVDSLSYSDKTKTLGDIILKDNE